MHVLDEIANVLHVKSEDLEKESLKIFLDSKLIQIESEIFRISQKYGVKSVLELDSKLKKGELNEEIVREDFMRLDNFESQRDEIIKALGKI